MQYRLPRFTFCLLWVLALGSFSFISAQTSPITRADSLVAIGEYPAALLELQQASPQTEAILLRKAEIHTTSGNYPAAIQSYKALLNSNPNRLLSTVAYAKLLSKVGQLKTADSIFTVVSQRYPDNAGFQYQLGLVKEKQQDSTSIRYFKRTLHLDSLHQGALFKVAKNYLSQQQFTKAEGLSEKGLQVNPLNPSLLSLFAQSLYHQRLYAKAIPAFQQLIRLGHGSEFIHTSLAYCHFMEHEFEKAIEQYEAALEIRDNNPEIHHRLGKLYASLGSLKKSEMHLLSALILKKQPIDAEFLSLALTYKLQENYKKAMDAIKNALEENPNNERALFEKALIAEQLYESLEKRLGFYETYVDKYGYSGNKGTLRLAKRRISDLKEEIHLSK